MSRYSFSPIRITQTTKPLSLGQPVVGRYVKYFCEEYFSNKLTVKCLGCEKFTPSRCE